MEATGTQKTTSDSEVVVDNQVSDDFGGHFQERVAHIIIKDKKAHYQLVELCSDWHRKQKNSMYIDFEQSLDSYKASQNSR